MAITWWKSKNFIKRDISLSCKQLIVKLWTVTATKLKQVEKHNEKLRKTSLLRQTEDKLSTLVISLKPLMKYTG